MNMAHMELVFMEELNVGITKEAPADSFSGLGLDARSCSSLLEG